MAATIVILGPADLSFVDTTSGAMRTTPLPGRGASVFVAPDGRVVVPAGRAEVTWLVNNDHVDEHWPGRLMPLFFDEPDRLWALLPDELVLLSYPERLPLRRHVVAGLDSVKLAAVSHNGRLVAAVQEQGGKAILWLLVPEDSQPVRRLPLPKAATALAVAAEAELVAVGLQVGGLVLVAPAMPDMPVRIETPGEVAALAFDNARRVLLVGCATATGGLLVGFRGELRLDKPPKELFRSTLRLPPADIFVAHREVLLRCGERVLVLGKGGRVLEREFEAPGAVAMALVPAETKSMLPAWSDR